MKKLKWLLILIPICFFTGCYNYRELNQLGITSAVGVNKTSDGYELIVQVMNTQKQGSDSGSTGDYPKFVTYKTTGVTIQEALRNVIVESPRRLYVNHISLLIISEEVAKEGIHDVIDLFARDTEFRKQFYVLISKDKNTENVLTTLTPLESLNAKNIKDSIDADYLYMGNSQAVTFEKMLNDYLSEYREISLSSIYLVGDEEKGEKDDNLKQSMPNAKILIGPVAVFKEDKLQGYLTKSQSVAYSFIKDEILNTIITHQCCDQKYASIEIVKSKTATSAVKNQPKIEIKVKSEGNINEINCDIDLTNPNDIKKLQTEISAGIETSIKNVINHVQSTYHSDIFGFEELIYKDNPEYFKQLKKQYGNKLFEQIEVEISVDLKLMTKGNLLKVIK